MKHIGIIWMSAGNSHFKEPVIKELLHFASTRFDEVIVLCPDQPAEHTFRALGHQDNELRKKARLNANLLQNRAKRMQATLSPPQQECVQIVEWRTDVAPNEHYLHSYKEILELFQSTPLFAADARETTRKVLEKKTAMQLSPAAIDEGTQYLLQELAFVLASLQIYHATKATYIYHQPWPIYEKLIAGEYDKAPKDGLAFLLHNPKV
jgi:cyclo(L-tyrosyl-L-tyrosyl) synthase